MFKNFLCWIGLHDFSKWKVQSADTQWRYCRNCNLNQRLYIYIIRN